MFEVVPSQDEIDKYGIPDTKGNSLVIISSVDKDHVWRASKDDDSLHRAAYSALIDGHDASKWLWVFLGPSD